MKPGGGKQKGNRFELLTGKELSRWMTDGERSDLFARNVISGGSFTKAQRTKQISGLPGDIMANHPMAFDFLKLFSIECKHKAELQLEAFLFDAEGKSFLWKTYKQAREQARVMGARAWLVAKQNRRPTLLIMDAKAAKIAARSTGNNPKLNYHLMHGNRLGFVAWDAFLSSVVPGIFLKQIALIEKEG